MNTDREIIELLNKILIRPIEIRKTDRKIESRILSREFNREDQENREKRDIGLEGEFAYIVNSYGVRPETQLALIDEREKVVRLYLNSAALKESTRLDNLFTLISRLKNLSFIFMYEFADSIDIPSEIKELVNLEILDIRSFNSIHIPREITNLPKLRIFRIQAREMNVPQEIVLQGLDSLKNYFSSLEESNETTFLYEAKLVFVGRGFAGKTSLIRKLTIPDYKLEKNIKSTEGIDIKYWDVNTQLEKSNSFKFNIWDFGGQEKYDATHQFFITERTLYIFVTEARQESNFLDFDYWLNVVQILGNDSPVIVVQNKTDLRKKQLPTERYKQQFPNIFGFVDVSCSEGYESTIEDLIAEIKSAIKTLPQIGDTLPKEWVDIRKALEKKRSDYISYDDYVKLCRKFGLSQDRADFLSHYYHDLGVVVHYSKDPLLKNMVIINPDWAVDGVYNVLDTKTIEENKGRFNNDDLKEIWDQPKYSKKHAELLALMKNYELCFELGDTGTYIAPELLPANPIPYKSIQKRDRLTFIYRYKFMPAGIMTRFIVKIHGLIDQDEFWKHGVLVKFEDARALVIEDDTNRQITIEIEGQRSRKELLAIIRKEFSEIHSSFKRKIQFEEFVPCNCIECKENDIPHLFKWETLKKYSTKDVDKIRCENSLIEVSVNALVGEVADTKNISFEDTIYLESPKDTENNKDTNKLENSNNYAPLLIGLSWWGVLALTIGLFAFTQIERFFLILFIVAFVITFPIIIAFTLVDKKRLSEENFVTILKMSFAKIPGLKWLSK